MLHGHQRVLDTRTHQEEKSILRDLDELLQEAIGKLTLKHAMDRHCALVAEGF